MKQVVRENRHVLNELNDMSVVARVQQMEQYLDEVFEEKEGFQEKLEVLHNYYESGLWLHDYACDERGDLPKDLKRGVLAQDTLYNLFVLCG